MKKFILLTGLICLMISLFTYQSATAGVFKWLRVGKYQTKVVDSGDQGEAAGEGTFAYWYLHDFTYSCIDHAGWQLGTKDWTDDKGTYWPFKISGAGHGNSDESTNTMPVTDDEGLTIRRYYRYQPPEISVDGYRLDEPFPPLGFQRGTGFET